MSWIEGKLAIGGATGLDQDALHIYASLVILVLAATLMRRSFASIWPWLVVLLFNVGNEVIDYTAEVWHDRTMQAMAGVHDLINTMVLPTLLLIGVRFTPRLFVSAVPADGAAS